MLEFGASWFITNDFFGIYDTELIKVVHGSMKAIIKGKEDITINKDVKQLAAY